jgi:hypothetical protein
MAYSVPSLARRVNYMLFPTLLIASILLAVGIGLGRRAKMPFLFWLCIFGLIIALPGIVFAAYYLKIFGEPIWLYKFRSVPFSELSAGGAGFLAGLLHGKFSQGVRFRRIAGRLFFPGILAIGLIVPYLKPLLRPPNWNQFQNRWSRDVCLQTSESSCGPACAATLLRKFGITATEKEIAAASLTSRNGTENWYLARALRARGLNVQFVFSPDLKNPWPYPAIAGVRLAESGGTGHFIAVLDRIGDEYVIGDPITGKSVQSQSDLLGSYEVTGFFMIVRTAD